VITSIYLDLDGVCADFHGGASRLAGVPSITTPAHRLAADMQTTYQMEDALGKDIWVRIRDVGAPFWEQLDPTPWLNDMMRLFTPGISIYVCSSPGGSIASGSVPGKIAWCKRYLPSIPQRNLIFTGHKHLLAQPDRLLIDDSDEMVDAWRAAGGNAFQVPHPWNRRWHETHHDVATLLDDHLAGSDHGPA
jgi:5'(3')-deoxyribonucleotidase